MRFLLDTQTLIWAVGDPSKLTARARAALEDDANELLVSAASAWEIATKYRAGRLPNAAPLAVDFDAVLVGRGLEGLSINTRHARLAGSLAGKHKDPFDRMIAAQGLLETAVVVSNDEALDQFGVRRLW